MAKKSDKKEQAKAENMTDLAACVDQMKGVAEKFCEVTTIASCRILMEMIQHEIDLSAQEEEANNPIKRMLREVEGDDPIMKLRHVGVEVLKAQAAKNDKKKQKSEAPVQTALTPEEIAALEKE